MGDDPPFVRVAVPLPVRGSFTYGVPAELRGRVRVGHVVRVPFGGRVLDGYVVGLEAGSELPAERIRPLGGLVDPVPAFDRRQLELLRWMADYYLAPLGEAIATALPSRLRGRSRQGFRATPEGVEALAGGELDEEAAELLREIVARPGLGRTGIERRLHGLLAAGAIRRSLGSLRRRGMVRAETVAPGGPGGNVRTVRLAGASGGRPRRGRRQAAVLERLAAAGGELDLAVLVAEQGPYAREAVRSLERAGLVRTGNRERRDPVSAGELPGERLPPELLPAQREVLGRILSAPRTWLLHGVTGSGKTEVYLRAAAAVLARGAQVLVLVPEIGLTPLLTGRFRARFGDDVAVLHSGLSPAERLREWRRIRAGEARVAVGARSALFAPFAELGLVVVDEEHDDSYKQDDGVRYNARDMAVVRGRRAGCPVVLGSATPSMESWFNAREGRYGLLELPLRATARPVPRVEIVDMRREPRTAGRTPLLSGAVRDALSSCFAQGGKAIVLYNRRGYATLVQCRDCGGDFSCPSCGIALVLHRRQRTLTCHYCGFHRPFPDRCPACSGELEVLGQGTERVEETLADTFPGVPIARMDADSTAPRGAHHRLLSDFREGRARLLVGTQIVAKGHDFPDVLVAAVLGADHSLMMPDFRSAERTFALLTQVAGRAGRGEIAGRVLVQTRHPSHPVIEHLGDIETFYREEARQRRLLGYPPFTRLALLRVESPRRPEAIEVAVGLGRSLRRAARGCGVQVLGPAAAALPRLLGRWRFQLLLRSREPAAFRSWLREQRLRAPRGRRVRVIVDVDPRSLV